MHSNTAHYVTILDAGSTGTRIFVYKWDTAGGADGFTEPLQIIKVFPLPDENDVESKPGIQDYKQSPHGPTMEAYLDPLLNQANKFLEGEADRNNQTVPIYLLATAGMRTKYDEKNQSQLAERNQILKEAWKRMRSNSFPTFDAGKLSKNALVISGQTEGLLAWVANNDGLERDNQISGIFEIGGYSAQIAFRQVESNGPGNDRKKICLFSNPIGHDVYSRSWDGLGVKIAWQKAFTAILTEKAGVKVNPCLPEFYKHNVTGMVGTGNFTECMKKAGSVLRDHMAQEEPISKFPTYPSDTPFLGLSTPMYSYDFFSKLEHVHNFDNGKRYNWERYNDAVKTYCEAQTLPDSHSDLRSKEIIHQTCFAAAWTLSMLHSPDGFNMSRNDDEILTFANEGDPRSSWTFGAATLLARHGNMTSCPNGIGPLSQAPFDNSARVGEVDWPPIFLSSDSVHPGFHNVATISEADQAKVCIADSNCVTVLWHFPTVTCIAAFSAILIVLVAFAHRRRRTSSAIGKIALPTDMKQSEV